MSETPILIINNKDTDNIISNNLFSLEDNNILFSFNEILKSSFIELGNMHFTRLGTSEILGVVVSKYHERSKMEAIANGGIIEFITLCKSSKITKIYGNTLNKNEKLFVGCSIKKI